MNNDDLSDNEISELYQAASRESSPAALDAEVLRLAREHADIHNKNKRLRKLAPGFSWAAIIVLSIGVILSIEFGDYSDVNQIHEKTPENMVEFKPAAPKKIAPSAKPKPKFKAKPKPMFEAEQDTAAGGAAMPSPAPLVPAPMASAPLAKEAPASGIERLARKRRAMKPSAAPGDATSNLFADSEKAETATKSQIAKSPEPIPAPKSIAPAEKSAPIITPASPPAIAEGRAELKREQLRQAMPAASAPAVARSKTSTAADCTALSHLACAASANCVLVGNPGGLQCQSTRNACEIGFNQISGNAKDCQQKPGCRFIESQCKCDPDSGDCQCDSNQPSQCVSN